MNANIAKGSITIITASNGLTINTWVEINNGNSLQQITSDNSFVPDWEKDNLILTPKVLVAGDNRNQITEKRVIISGTDHDDDLGWFIRGEKVGKIEGTTQVGNILDATVNNDTLQLTIKRNLTQASVANIEFKALYLDQDNVPHNVFARVEVKKIANGAKSIAVVITTDGNGNVIDGDDRQLRLTAHAYRGTTQDDTDMDFKWYHRGETGWEAITNQTPHIKIESTDAILDADGELKGNVCIIEPDFIVNCDVIRVTVQDEDPLSATHGLPPAEDILEVKDYTDPYMIEFSGATVLSSETPSTRITAYVTQSGIRLGNQPSNLPNSDGTYNWNWEGYDRDGEQLDDWEESHKAERHTNSVTINKSEFIGRAVLTCAVTNIN